MSIEAISKVWKSNLTDRSSLLVYLALADYANHKGEAWPSVKTLARKSRLSKRQTQRILQNLHALGWLLISPNKGPNGCNLYTIPIP